MIEYKDPEYIAWIRHQECIDCGGYEYQLPNGDWQNTPSHIKTRGSGGEDYNNVVPMCLICHIKFENQVKSYKERYLKIAEKLTEEYIDQKLIENNQKYVI